MKNELIQTAIENLQKEIPISIELKGTVPVDETLVVKWDGHQIQLLPWVRNEIRTQFYPQLAERFKNQKDLILVANKIYPKVKELLRADGIPYIETAGNIFLNRNGIYILLEHAKATSNRAPLKNKAFTKSGLRVVYQFLTYPEILNEPYRTIAEKAGVALGNIPAVIDSLKDAGFLLRKDKQNLMLDRKKELLEKWIDAYSLRLKPSLKIGEFRPKNDNDWTMVKLDSLDSTWGGEAAGEFYTKYLRPERGTIYTRLGKAELIKKYGLIPQKNGPIEVLEVFWENLPIEDPEFNVKLPYVSAILAYADLIQTGDKRCMDTAQRIFDEYIQSKL